MNQTIKDKLVAQAASEFEGLLREGIDQIVGDMENTLRARELGSESALSGYKYNVAANLSINPGTDSAEVKVGLSWGQKTKLVGQTRTIDDQPDLPEGEDNGETD